jgi:predicted nucleic acid-binding protein
MAERVALDANVLDWLLEPNNLSMLLELRERGSLEPIVTAEVAHEIDRMKGEKTEKKAALKQMIVDHFKPVKPTWIPIAGLVRSGLAYIATPRTQGFLAEIRAHGLRKLDALHVTNAHFHQCVAFLTLDERLLKKQSRIKSLTALKLERPEVRVRMHAR